VRTTSINTGDRSLRHSLIPIALALICSIVVPVFAEEISRTPSVIRVKECQIILTSERLLASGQSGIVSIVQVREGDRVHQGQLLAELDASVSKATLAIAVKQAENDVNVRFARAAARVAQAEYESALDANRRQKGTFTRIELDKLRLEEERSLLQTEVADHEFDVNQLRRDEAAALVESYRIVAPMNGIISRVFKSPGEAVQVGESLLECQSTDKVHVEAHVDIRLLQLVGKGRQVTVVPMTPHPAAKVDATGLEGTVFFVGVFADLVSQTVRVLVEVDNQSGLLLAGTEAVLEIAPPSAATRPETVQRD